MQMRRIGKTVVEVPEIEYIPFDTDRWSEDGRFKCIHCGRGPILVHPHHSRVWGCRGCRFGSDCLPEHFTGA